MPTDVVLIIDDEPDSRRVVSNALAVDGTRVIESSTAVAGIDAAAAQRSNLVVLDLGLPDAAGIEVRREIRRRSVAVAHRALGAKVRDEVFDATLESGGADGERNP